MKTIINVKTDPRTKQEAAKLAQELGLTLSAVVQASLREFIRSKSFSVSAAPRMTPYLERLIGGTESDFRLHKNISGPFHDSGEVDAHLDSL